MNYYFPYGMTGYPYFSVPRTSTGLFSRIFRNGINWSSILNGTQRTLNIINQTIPTIKQITPVVRNAKTMFKVMNEFKKTDNVRSNTVSTNNESTNSKNIENINTVNTNNVDNVGPTFFA